MKQKFIDSNLDMFVKKSMRYMFRGSQLRSSALDREIFETILFYIELKR